jgi:hypothetical protein
MKIHDLMEEAKKDLNIDITKVTEEIINTSNIARKWLDLKTQQAAKINLLVADHKRLEAKKRKYYTGKYSDQEIIALGWELNGNKILKGDVQLWLDDDDDIITSQNKLAHQKEIQNYIESVISQIDQKRWTLKNYIDYKRFLEGN